MSNLFIEPAAVLSDCGRYRYSLSRTWDRSLPVLAFVMLNPSTADATKDDPTIRKCMGFARAWGYGAIVVVNLFAYRATNPKVVLAMGREAIAGEPSPFYDNRNDAEIIMATVGRRVICAWGRDGGHLGRAAEVVALLKSRPLECLKLTKDGQPWHPLYIAGATQPIAFAPAAPRPRGLGELPAAGRKNEGRA